MGTTAQKAERVLQSIADVQEGINNLGGNLTNQTPFKDFKAQLDNIYDVLPKTSFQTGTDITIENGLKGKLDFEKAYQEVEYIESSGTQYINTGVNPNQDISIEAKLYTEETGNKNWFGSVLWEDSNITGIGFNSFSTTQVEWIFNKNSIWVRSNATDIVGKPFIVKFGNGKLEINNNQIATFTTPDFSIAQPISIFIRTGGIAYISGRVYYFKIYDGDTLVRDFIPCYRKSDNVIGLYDKVEDKFYTNAGTGTFTKGADVGSGFDDIAGFGQNSQVSTTGIQLLPIKEISEKTENGITYSVKNGIMRLNGTATGGFNIYFVGSYSQGDLSLESGEYTFAGQVISGSRVSGICGKYVRDYANDTMIIDGNQIETTITKTLTEDYSGLSCYLYISSGTVLDNLVVGLSLYKGLYTSQTIPAWERYSGGYASPSPDWKQEIKCVAGKNKYNEDEATLGTISQSDGKTISPSSDVKYTPTYTEVNPNEEWSFSNANTGNIALRLFYYDKNKDYISTSIVSGAATGVSFVTLSNAFYIRYQLNVSIDNNLQLERGKAASYLPYNTLEITKRGLSEINIDYPTTTSYGVTCTNNGNGTYTFNGTAERDIYFDMAFFTLPKGTHKLVGCPSGGSWASYIQYIRRVDGQAFSINDMGNGGQSEVVGNEGQLRLSILIANGYTCNNLVFKPMVTTDLTATYNDFEPYITPENFQLSLGDIKPCGIGDYKDYFVTDRSTKKWYIHKNISIKKINTTDTWIFAYDSTRSLINVTKASLNIPRDASTGTTLCSAFREVTNDNDFVVGTYRNNGNVDNLWIKVPSSVTNTDEAKAYLNDINSDFVGVIRTPEETEIPDGTLKTQLEALYNAQSIKGTTIIESNGDLPIIIKTRALKGAA